MLVAVNRAVSEMVDPAQLRMARAALNWSHGDLARAAAVHRNTISNFENGKHVVDRRRLGALRRALESAGVEFIADTGDGPGVRLRKPRSGRVAVGAFAASQAERH